MPYTPYPYDDGDWVPERLESPSIAIAVRFMYAGACLEILATIVNVLRIHSLTGPLMSRFPNATVGQVHDAEVFGGVITVIGGLISAGIWCWMARANGAGRGWARIVATLLFAACALVTLLVLMAGDVEASIGSGLNLVVATCATAFLWRRDASQYIAQARGW
jgi:hypothetical protein